MKYLIALAIVACAIGSSECVSEEIRQKIFHQMTVRCSTKEGGTQADIDGIIGFKPTDTPQSKCIEACLGEASGVIKDNQIDPEAASVIASIVYKGDDKRIHDAESIAKSCVGVSDPDRCESAFKMLLCAEKAAKAMGYERGLI